MNIYFSLIGRCFLTANRWARRRSDDPFSQAQARSGLTFSLHLPLLGDDAALAGSSCALPPALREPKAVDPQILRRLKLTYI